MLKIFYFLLTVFRIIKYLFSNTKRYSHILIEIILTKPKSIIEIGVYKGKRSKEILQAALIFNSDIEYYGFDLFELIDDDIIKKELSKKPLSEKEIKLLLSRYGKIKLYKGYTNNTLHKVKNVKADFIFIDGGHTVKTIKSDWKNSIKFTKKNTVIIFDDYYVDDKKLIKKFGCNLIIKSIPKKIFVKKFYFFKDTFLYQGKNLNIKIFKLKKR